MTASTITLATSPPNRASLAEAFGQNQNQVRYLENLGKDVTGALPDAIEQALVLAAIVANSQTLLPNLNGQGVYAFMLANSSQVSVPSPAVTTYATSGTTAQRPAAAPDGWMYEDITLAPYGMPIMRSRLSTTTGWINSAGVRV